MLYAEIGTLKNNVHDQLQRLFFFFLQPALDNVLGFEIAIVCPFERQGSLLHNASALREILKHSACMSVSCMIGSSYPRKSPTVHIQRFCQI